MRSLHRFWPRKKSSHQACNRGRRPLMAESFAGRRRTIWICYNWYWLESGTYMSIIDSIVSRSFPFQHNTHERESQTDLDQKKITFCPSWHRLNFHVNRGRNERNRAAAAARERVDYIQNIKRENCYQSIVDFVSCSFRAVLSDFQKDSLHMFTNEHAR